jgi:hypothetical protein
MYLANPDVHAALLHVSGGEWPTWDGRWYSQNYYEFTTVVRFEAFRPDDQIVGTS